MPPYIRRPLTPRQREMLALLAEGITRAEVAERLHVGHKTVCQMILEAYERVGVSDQRSLILWWREHKDREP